MGWGDAFVKWIGKNVLHGAEWEEALDKLKGFFGQIGADVQVGVARALPTAAMSVLNWMLQYIQAMRGGIMSIALTYINLTTGSDLTEADLEGKSYKYIAEVTRKAYAQHPIQYMLGLIMPESVEDPSVGLEGAERFLNVNMAFQLDAWILHLIGDVATLGKVKSLKDLPNAISWSFGIGWLSWLVMGTPFRVGISDPLERYYNKVYRPELPNERQLAQMWIMDQINGSTYRDLMGQLGHSDEKATFLYDYFSDHLSRAQIRDLYQQGVWDEQRVDTALRWLGYNKKFREQAKLHLFNERLFDLKEDLDREVLRAFRDGRFSRDQATSYFERRGWSQEEIQVALSVQGMYRGHRRDLSDSELKDARDLGLITQEEWEARMQAKGYTPEDVQLLVSMEQTRKERQEAMRLYWTRRQRLVSKLSDADVEDYWSVAKDELDKIGPIEVGKMSTEEWVNTLNSIVKKYSE